MNETDLKLEIIGKGNSLGPFSARGCTQTLSFLSHDILRRTINGDLMCVGNSGHRKFVSTISCQDKAPPGFDGLWKGSLLKVECIQCLTHVVPPHMQKVQLERDAISFHLYEYSGKKWSAEKLQDRWMAIPAQFPGGFLTYRPELQMIVQNYFLESDEWGLVVGWRLELEEQ